MSDFYNSMEAATAVEIQRLSGLMYELRLSRDRILAGFGVAGEAELLARIQSGELPEHPAYERYLAARVLADTRDQVREVLAERLREVNR
ncbi:MAG: hypothetical protein KF778_06660 [Rhodocyclaceae bacterium]|nr:hypothetical protein [Rhodocyclaceae bacterium]MBX3668068.1 hypothetical protein [Rhodocyclaceae bacterium]